MVIVELPIDGRSLGRPDACGDSVEDDWFKSVEFNTLVGVSEPELCPCELVPTLVEDWLATGMVESVVFKVVVELPETTTVGVEGVGGIESDGL